MGFSNYSVQNSLSNRVSKHYYTKSADEIFTQNKVKRIHPSMDPKGIIVRECLDSEAHPLTVPIILSLDLTGSMQQIPLNLIRNGLPKLMGRLVQNGVKDASLLFVGVGDHECDDAPLQVGQFESGDEELDLWLTRTWIEGGGGGNGGESYLLAWYFGAFHTKIDSFEKRGKKGFLFTIGDEPCLRNLPARSIAEIIAEGQHSTFTEEQLLAKAQEKYNVFHIHVLEGQQGHSSLPYWKKLLGQNCIEVSDYETIPTVVAEIVMKNSEVTLVAPATDLTNTQEIL